MVGLTSVGHAGETRTCPQLRVEGELYALISAVYRDIDHRVLVDVAEQQPVADDELLRLETCSMRLNHVERRKHHADALVGMNTLSLFLSLPCCSMRSTTYGTVEPAACQGRAPRIVALALRTRSDANDLHSP